MGNRGRTHNFHKVATVKTVGETLTSTKNRKNEHVNNLSVCDTDKDDFRNSLQNETKTEKSFSKQESKTNSERANKANSEETTSNANLDSNEWKRVQYRRRKNKRYIETLENKNLTRKMGNERFKYLERCRVQSSSRQPILNKTSEKKFQSREQSKCINSVQVKNKIDRAFKNSQSNSSNVEESVNQNYKKYVENTVHKTVDESIAKLNSRESIKIQEKQSENLVLNSEMPRKHSLESNAKNCLRNNIAITKTSQYTQTFEQAIDTASFNFITDINKQSMLKTKELKPQHEKNDLQSDLLISEEKVVSGKKCCKIFKDETICRKHFHGNFQETPTNTNQCNNKNVTQCLKEQISKDSKANLGSEEKVNDQMTDICDEYSHVENRSPLKDENITESLEHGLHNCTGENAHFPSHPAGMSQLYPYMPNATFGQYFDENSDSDIPYYFRHAKLFNENHQRDSNDPNAHPMPHVLSWCKEETVYYWYNQDFLPDVCSCLACLPVNFI